MGIWWRRKSCSLVIFFYLHGTGEKRVRFLILSWFLSFFILISLDKIIYTFWFFWLLIGTKICTKICFQKVHFTISDIYKIASIYKWVLAEKVPVESDAAWYIFCCVLFHIDCSSSNSILAYECHSNLELNLLQPKTNASISHYTIIINIITISPEASYFHQHKRCSHGTRTAISSFLYWSL